MLAPRRHREEVDVEIGDLAADLGQGQAAREPDAILRRVARDVVEDAPHERALRRPERADEHELGVGELARDTLEGLERDVEPLVRGGRREDPEARRARRAAPLDGQGVRADAHDARRAGAEPTTGLLDRIGARARRHVDRGAEREQRGELEALGRRRDGEIGARGEREEELVREERDARAQRGAPPTRRARGARLPKRHASHICAVYWMRTSVGRKARSASTTLRATVVGKRPSTA